MGSGHRQDITTLQRCSCCWRQWQVGLALLTCTVAQPVKAAAAPETDIRPTAIAPISSVRVRHIEAEPVDVGSQRIAQVVPDATLGTEASVVNPGVVNNLPVDLIEGGAARGANLFHSFSDFNVNTGQSVYFANPTGIENILSRVTGGNVSNIDGLLGVDGAANLFLLNPNGVVFGPNASLDISGSFVTSTGSSFAFADGSTFSATAIGNELLTVSVPLGVQFNQPVQGDITHQGNLAVGAGETLTLLGNTVLSSGGLTAEGGTVQLLGNQISLVDAALIDVSGSQGGNIRIEGDDIALSSGLIDISGTVAGGDLAVYADDQLTLGVEVNAAGGGNALFDPPTLDIDAAAATTIVSTVSTGGTSTQSASETINVNAPITVTSGTGGTLAFTDENSDGNLTINLNALIDLSAGHTLSGEGTTVNVNTTTPGIVQNGLDVATTGATVSLAPGTYQEGRQLTLTDDVTLNGAGPTSILDGNDSHRVLEINAGVTAAMDDLTISNGSSSDGGGIFNDGTLTILGGTISGNTAQFGSGIFNDGTLTITGGTISGNNTQSGGGTVHGGGGIFNNGTLTVAGGTISDNNAGNGGGGGIFNDGTLTILGGTIGGNTAIFGGGIHNDGDGIHNGGTLTISGGTISANNGSSGGGISNLGTLTISGGTISSNTAFLGGGIYNASTLTISGGTISANDGSSGAGIFTNVPVTITNSGPLTITQSIFSQPDPINPTSLAVGDIRLSSPVSIILSPGVQITSNTTNEGQGGSVIVQTPRLILQSGSAISASTASTGQGGNLIFSVSEAIALRGGSLINTQATRSGDAGRIQIDTPFLVGDLNENNDIIATATSGNGGQVLINVTSILGFTPTNEASFTTLRGNGINDVSVGSQTGDDGTLDINALELDPSQGVNELPADLTDRSNQITPGCGISNTDDGSSFIITGSGGLPPNPSDPITANDIEVDWITYDGADSTAQVIPPQQPIDNDAFVEAQGLIVDPDGTIHFVADVAATQQSGLPTSNLCAAAIHATQ